MPGDHGRPDVARGRPAGEPAGLVEVVRRHEGAGGVDAELRKRAVHAERRDPHPGGRRPAGPASSPSSGHRWRGRRPRPRGRSGRGSVTGRGRRRRGHDGEDAAGRPGRTRSARAHRCRLTAGPQDAARGAPCAAGRPGDRWRAGAGASPATADRRARAARGGRIRRAVPPAPVSTPPTGTTPEARGVEHRLHGQPAAGRGPGRGRCTPSPPRPRAAGRWPRRPPASPAGWSRPRRDLDVVGRRGELEAGRQRRAVGQGHVERRRRSRPPRGRAPGPSPAPGASGRPPGSPARGRRSSPTPATVRALPAPTSTVVDRTAGCPRGAGGAHGHGVRARRDGLVVRHRSVADAVEHDARRRGRRPSRRRRRRPGCRDRWARRSSPPSAAAAVGRRRAAEPAAPSRTTHRARASRLIRTSGKTGRTGRGAGGPG